MFCRPLTCLCEGERTVFGYEELPSTYHPFVHARLAVMLSDGSELSLLELIVRRRGSCRVNSLSLEISLASYGDCSSCACSSAKLIRRRRARDTRRRGGRVGDDEILEVHGLLAGGGVGVGGVAQPCDATWTGLHGGGS